MGYMLTINSEGPAPFPPGESYVYFFSAAAANRTRNMILTGLDVPCAGCGGRLKDHIQVWVQPAMDWSDLDQLIDALPRNVNLAELFQTYEDEVRSMEDYAA